ncbi:MAG TPA: PrgI family protein [Candidatus Paceibacterota bacterium]|nr:PrgI family protein [Candidatus Paceibacterota bacterium]HPT18012.1 PrgI family protein [Candidatus Paceibacterota bacterium]
MQFKVPQFLDIEDKIFGPFTFSQFVYLAGGAGLCFVLYKLLGFLLGFIPILAVAAFAVALTFYKPNGKPFINTIEAGLKYMTQNKLYIWKRRKQKITTTNTTETQKKDDIINNRNTRLTNSKLQDLAWSLDVLDSKKEDK